MEVVVIPVAVTHERVSASATATTILDGTILVQFGFQQINPVIITRKGKAHIEVDVFRIAKIGFQGRGHRSGIGATTT